MSKRSHNSQNFNFVAVVLGGCYSIEKIAKQFLADKCQNAFEQFIL